MRFLHTADWHLGRLFHGVHLTDDQAYVLTDLVRIARESRLDAILIAGDLYDRAVPPPEAVALLDEILHQLVVELRIPVVLIAGNHDSPIRLEFGNGVLRKQGLHVVGSPSHPAHTITMKDAHGEVLIHAVPYAEPAVLRACTGVQEICDHHSGMQAVVNAIRSAHCHPRTILMGHATVLGGEESESERPLSVGGASTIDPACFEGFSYVALGHLHRPQSLADGRIRYSGSLMKYSFSESAHRKTINIVEMDAAGACRVESIPVAPRRDVRCLKGVLAELLQPPAEGRDDYVHVTLEDTGVILDPIGKLRDVYPNILAVERVAFDPTGACPGPRQDPRRITDLDLFANFFAEVTGVPLSPDESSSFVAVVDQMHQQEREAAQ